MQLWVVITCQCQSAFYTSISGYKICVRLYLNGDGSARGFFCLCDKRTMIEKTGTVQPKHIIEFFRPDANNVSSQRPCSAMNIASNIPKFFFLNENSINSQMKIHILLMIQYT